MNKSERSRLSALTADQVADVYCLTIGYNPLHEGGDISKDEMIEVLVSYPEPLSYPVFTKPQ